MEQNGKKPSHNQIFSRLRLLCVNWKLDDAKEILRRAAGLEGNDGRINYEQIRRSAKNRFLPKMADIVETFSELKDYYAKDDPDDADSLRQVDNLNKILPSMTDNEKIVCYQNLSILYENYHPANHDIQGSIYQNIINLAPRGKADSVLYGAMLKVKFLRIPVGAKYEMISKARQKSSGSEIFDAEYRKTLGQLSKDYFWHLLNEGSSAEKTFSEREKNLRAAYNLIGETGANRMEKCQMRLRVLENISVIYQRQISLLKADKRPDSIREKLIIGQKLEKVWGSARSQLHSMALLRKSAKGFSVAYDKYR